MAPVLDAVPAISPTASLPFSSEGSKLQIPDPRAADVASQEMGSPAYKASLQRVAPAPAPSVTQNVTHREPFASSDSEEEPLGFEVERLDPQLQAEAEALAEAHDPGVHAQNWQQDYGGRGEKSGKDYAIAFWETVMGTHATLGNHSLSTHLLDLGKRRRAMARNLNHAKANDYGIKASGLLQTPIGKKYLGIKGVAEFMEACRQPDGLATWKGSVQKDPKQTSGLPPSWQIIGSLPNGQAVALTKIIWDKNPDRDSKELFAPVWRHGVATSAIEEHMEALFFTALNSLSSVPDEDGRLKILAPKVGTLHWWLAHTCPFKRGSAAVADMLAAALFRHHGLKWPGWAPGVSADVVALCTPDQEHFATNYVNLLRVKAS